MSPRCDILGHGEPEACGAFLLKADGKLNQVNKIWAQSPAPSGQVDVSPAFWFAAVGSLFGGCGVFCVMATCYYCGTYAHKVRTYDGIRMHVCYNCISKRASRKAAENNRRHREGNKVRAALIKKHGKVCQKCGAKPGEIHAHHKTRLMDGGQHTEENMVLLCPECHREAHKDGTRW
jgi:5-methylcytosine-specific restriction endonuclease McrA